MQNYEAAGQAAATEPTPSANEAQSQHMPANMETEQERIMYQQEGVNEEVMQPGNHMHYVEGDQPGQQ